ncbi:RNA-dependent RNA polymerase [Beihai weivirus-like virus 3]|uniref:RNA-dependent RNA polymerase n=1 Tax=Beihai weivirus-like virus 3 TaxID=1922751 RepID=UPI00090B231E|nr:RNA-dependent RNA polymerase [Beihai weivirus-like virus 3]APG78093.1 RNA-dependent RNA polymerase [Beihai weivirus-like virus 3]
MLASVPSGITWAYDAPPELLEIAGNRAGSWKITTWEFVHPDKKKLKSTSVILTEHEFNSLNATARQCIASASKEQVLRGSLEQTAARMWKTGGLEDVALRTLGPELVLRWLRAGQVQTGLTFHFRMGVPLSILSVLGACCCGSWRTIVAILAKKVVKFRSIDLRLGLLVAAALLWDAWRSAGTYRTILRWVGPSSSKTSKEKKPAKAAEIKDDPPKADAGPSGDKVADPSVSEEAEARAKPQENADLAVRTEEQEARVTMEGHGRYRIQMIEDKKVCVVLGQDYDKSVPKDRFPDVGVIVAPCSDLPNVYTNSAGNVHHGVEERLIKKSKPCTWTKDDKLKVGKFIYAAMGPKGIFSTDRVRSWYESHFALEDMRSSKWSESRFVSTFEGLLAQVNPTFKFKTAVKAEHMPEGKAPRFLIADGDEGQVLALAAVKCMEEVLFEVMESHSIKHVCKQEAMKRLLGHMVPPNAAKKAGCTFVEGDGSAWDTTCSTAVRGMVENPILQHISRILAQTYIQPQSWAEAHDKANAAQKLKLYFKKYHETMHVEITAIRRSGHRGTSVLNWWINFTMWVCSLFDKPQIFLCPDARWADDVAGVRRWFYGVYEGDDSGASTSPKLCQVSEADVTALKEKKITLAELGNKYRVPEASVTASISALAFWDRAGFNMKWVFARKRGTMVGCHLGLTETDSESKTGCVVPNGVFCPELPRALKGAVSCSPAIIEAVRKGDYKTIKTIAAAAALGRAADFAGKVPTLSRKYLAYANELDSSDFEDREMSMRTVGEEGMSAAAVRAQIEEANGAVSAAEEKTFLEALDYTASVEELEEFCRYPWQFDAVDQHDEFACSVPAAWRDGASI